MRHTIWDADEQPSFDVEDIWENVLILCDEHWDWVLLFNIVFLLVVLYVLDFLLWLM